MKVNLGYYYFTRTLMVWMLAMLTLLPMGVFIFKMDALTNAAFLTLYAIWRGIVDYRGAIAKRNKIKRIVSEANAAFVGKPYQPE